MPNSTTRQCGNCHHMLVIPTRREPILCCNIRTVLETFDTTTIRLKEEVQADKDASTCAVFSEV
jgi:hypothetical protein